MLNIAFNGNIFYDDGQIASDVAYRLFFKNNNNVAVDTWSDIRYTESGLHQYNLNLGDPDILYDSGASNGDEVIILFWIPLSDNHHSLNITQYSIIHYTLDGRQTFPQDVQLKPHQTPTCSFSVSGNYVNEETYLHDTGSTDYFQWLFSGKRHFHSCSMFGESIFDKNCTPTNGIEIDWGDGFVETGLDISNSPFEHTYITSGDFDIYTTLTNSDGLQCVDHDMIHITHNVGNGLSWLAPVYQNQDTEYIPNITGSTNKIQGVDYYVDGVLTYTDLGSNESFHHTFATNGTHIIKQCISYNDGFNDLVKCEEYSVNMGLISHFDELSYGCGMVFESNSIVGSPPVINYEWEVRHDNDVISSLSGDTQNLFYFAFPFIGVFRIKLSITDQNHTAQYEREYNIQECPGSNTNESGGSSGGGSPWIYKEHESLPVIQIVDIKAADNKKIKFLILDIKDIS